MAALHFEPMDSALEIQIRQWQAATAWWREQLGLASDAAVAWQPFARSHSISGLLIHIAEVESYWTEEVVAGRPRSESEKELLRVGMTSTEEEVWAEPYPWSLCRHLETLDFVRGRSLSTLRSAQPNAEFDVNGRTWPLWEIIAMLTAHESYHAGQAVLHKLHHGFGGAAPA